VRQRAPGVIYGHPAVRASHTQSLADLVPGFWGQLDAM
jgi:hypothetical protein